MISPSPALPRLKAFSNAVHSVIIHASMGTYPARAIIRCHADSCPPSPPESKNVSSNSIFCVLPSYVYGRILSVPSRSSSFIGVDFANIKLHANRCIHGLGRVIQIVKTKIHANRFRCGLGHVIGSGKTINLLLSLVHPHGPRCRIWCELHCLASFVRIELLSSCQNNCLWSCSVLLNIHHPFCFAYHRVANWVALFFRVDSCRDVL